MPQFTLLKWLGLGRGSEVKCREGKELVWLYRIVMPSEESARVARYHSGNVKAERIIDREIFNRWKRVRFTLYIDLKKYTIPIERGLRIVLPEYKREVDDLLKYTLDRLTEIQREIWQRIPPDLAEKLWDRESLYPARNFRWQAFPIEICKENLDQLTSLAWELEEQDSTS